MNCRSIRISVVALMVGALTPTFADQAHAAIRDVIVTTANQTYAGACPTTLTFTIAMDGDPGTMFSQQLLGDGPPPTKLGYGYIPPSSSLSFNVDLTLDAAHAGAHYVQARIKFGNGPGDKHLVNSLDSDKLTYTVLCASPSPSPPPRRRSNV